MSEQDETPRTKRRASRDEEVPEGVNPETGEVIEQTSGEAAEAEGSTDIAEALEVALRENRERLEGVLAVSLEGHECDKCGATGFLPPGAAADAELVHPDTLVTCDGCNGYGQVITGSKAPGRETTVCIACSGNGYRTVTREQTNVTPIAPAATTAPASVMGFMGADGVFVPLGQSQTPPQYGSG